MRTLELGMGAFLVLLSLRGSIGAAQETGDPERGGQLYVENCAVCHGLDGKGRIGANLENFPGIDVDAAITETITNGISGSVMPAWGRASGGPLSEEDIADVVAYVQGAFVGSDPIAPAPTYIAPQIAPLLNIDGDPSAGAAVYQANCFACHGPGGQGRFGVTLAKSWSGNQPELYIRSVVSQGIQGTTMLGWAQASGGPLGDMDIADVAAYILTLTPTGSSPAVSEPQEGPISLNVALLILAALLAVAIVVGIIYYRTAGSAGSHDT